MATRILLLVVAMVGLCAPTADADIFRWDNGELIPGTKRIVPGPGVELSRMNLEFANLAGAILTDANLSGIDLTEANLTNASLDGATLTNASLDGATLTNANLSGAVVTGAGFSSGESGGLTKEQLYSTASYRSRDLQGIRLWQNDVAGWDFSAQNLTGAHFGGNLTNADFTQAVVRNASFNSIAPNGNLGSTLTKEQLYSTASYRAKDLSGIQLWGQDATGWDFSGQDLSGAGFRFPLGGSANLTNVDFTAANLSYADLRASTFANTDLTDAIVEGARFNWAHSLTKEQFYATASYKARNLRGIEFSSNDTTSWDFASQDLTNSSFEDSDLSSADFSNAKLSNVNLSFTNLTNTILTGASLKGAYLEDVEMGLESARFDADTVYSQWTVFPNDFDPVAAGLFFVQSPRGDFDANDVVDVADVDMLAGRLRDEFIFDRWLYHLIPMFDLDNNGTSTLQDHRIWVHDVAQTWLGDADLNGEFNSHDLVQALAGGRYETTTRRSIFNLIIDPAGWAEGDWNADGEFTSADLVLALADGGYEQGLRPIAVPEPSGILLLIVAMAAIALRVR